MLKIALITLITIQIGTLIFFICRSYLSYKIAEKNIDAKSLTKEIYSNKKEFLQLLNASTSIYNLSEIEDFLSIDCMLMKKIEKNEIRPIVLKKYNDFLVNSSNYIGSRFFDFYEAKTFIEDMMCI